MNILKDKIVRVMVGYRQGDVGKVFWEDEDNLVCKVMFLKDDEIYGYDVNDLRVIE